MKRYLYIFLLVLPVTLFAQNRSGLSLIPEPASVKINKGNLALKPNVVIKAGAAERITAKFLVGYLKNNWSINAIVTSTPKPGQQVINLKTATSLPAEGYQLKISPTAISISGNNAGLFYGVQTLMQLFLAKKQGAVLPCIEIADAPRFSYRGLMLDVSRHFFTVPQIKDLLDLMAFYKLNRFHWHLTDDQGWRLEIKSYPKLTEVGAWRVPRLEFSGNTLPPQLGEKATDGGFYTQEQVKEVIAYAAARHIEVMPEVDVPGHSMAAVAAYPELSVTKNPETRVNPGSPFAKWFTGGGFEMYVDNTLNPTDENVYRFLDKVFGEVAALFPYPYIHIGGDECYKGYWEKDAGVKAFMQQHNIKDTHALQSYFISRVNKIVASKNKKLIGWDEILDGGLNDNVTVMGRFGEKRAIEQIKSGHDVVLAPGGNSLYFDYAQSLSEMEPSSHGGNATAWKAYNFNPDFKALTKTERKHILGIEACVWTEQIATVSKLQYMLLPRMLALAETGWTDTVNKDYNAFAENVQPQHLKRFDETGINYRVPTGFSYTDTVINANNFRLEMRPPLPGAKIFFTLNNRHPGDYDHEYKKPVLIMVPEGKKIVIKTIVITPSGRRSVVTRTQVQNNNKGPQ